MDEPNLFEIRVEGTLTDRWAEWFEGMTIRNLPCGHSVLRGTLVDQAALFGLLNKIQGLNLTLVAVNRVTARRQE